MNSQLYLFDDREPPNPLPRTLAGSNAVPVVVSVVVGAYAFYKASELLGLPVRRSLEDFCIALDRFVQMAQNQLPLLLPAPPSPAATADDQQEDSPSSPLSMFSSASGLISKGVRGVAGAFSRAPRKVPAGLGNMSNSCYQNSVIQGLASLPSLRDHLEKTTAEYKDFGPDSTYGALSDMIKQLNDPANHGQYFWIQGVLKAMDTVYQQDAQEYYSKVLDALDTEIKKAAKTEDGQDGKEKSDSDAAEAEQPIVSPNPLDGLLAQRVGCVNCGYTEGLSLIPFNCITVPLGYARAYDIADCLNEYTHLEYIEDVECAKCTLLRLEATLSKVADRPQFAAQLAQVQKVLKEGNIDDKVVVKDFNMKKKYWVKTTKSRQCVVARAPKALAIHINRSMFDEMTGLEEKNFAHVAYPRVLDLGPWCLGHRPSKNQKVDEEVEESWPRDPNQSMVAAKAVETAPSPFQYALKAAVTHWGVHGNGHYICYRQHPFSTADETEQNDEPKAAEVEDDAEEEEKSKHHTSEEQWWRLSDTSVAEVSEEEALSQDNVFMLFYERIDADATAVAAAEPEAALATADAKDETVPSAAQEKQTEENIDPILAAESASSPLLATAKKPAQMFPAQAFNPTSDSTDTDSEEALPTSPAKRQRIDAPQESGEEPTPSFAAPTSCKDHDGSETSVKPTPPDVEADAAFQSVDTSFPSTTGTETSQALSEDTEMTEPSENGNENDDGSMTGASTTVTSESGDDVDMEKEEAQKQKEKEEEKEKEKEKETQQHPVMRTAGDGSASASTSAGESLPIVSAV